MCLLNERATVCVNKTSLAVQKLLFILGLSQIWEFVSLVCNSECLCLVERNLVLSDRKVRY